MPMPLLCCGAATAAAAASKDHLEEGEQGHEERRTNPVGSSPGEKMPVMRQRRPSPPARPAAYLSLHHWLPRILPTFAPAAAAAHLLVEEKYVQMKREVGIQRPRMEWCGRRGRSTVMTGRSTGATTAPARSVAAVGRSIAGGGSNASRGGNGDSVAERGGVRVGCGDDDSAEHRGHRAQEAPPWMPSSRSPTDVEQFRLAKLLIIKYLWTE
ncbi:hypothetical protein GUJ93_ZPchr0013g37304 [Zizania palustris]|uniref:Uncharacterized protein n=1 Tax=Zizania palustris TaxID=103762 RepID=A0A8J5WYU2_ZIZPA|nr:hypothetical protein GUJ93_ZPchr0013g37304 [Zizania palustris]